MERYSIEVRVPVSECDIKNRWKFSCILRRMQEISSLHLEAVNAGYQELWEEGYVFLLSKILLRAARRPLAGEKLRIVTWPIPPKGAQFLRNVSFYDEAGCEIIYSQSAWILADPHSHRVYRPVEYPYRIPYEDGPFTAEAAGLRWKAPEGLEAAGERAVRYSDLDNNGHMNNAVYGDIICDFLPFEELSSREISVLKIRYVHEARHGDRLAVFSGKKEDTGGRYLMGERCGEKCFEAEVEYG